MKILFTSPILEYPAAGGPQLRIQNSILALSRISDLDIIHRAHKPTAQTNRTDSFFAKSACNYTTIYSTISGPRWLSFLFKLFRTYLQPTIPLHGRFIVDYIKSNNIDAVWFGFGNISYPLVKYVRHRLPGIKIVCDTDSVWSRFVLRELPYSKGLRAFGIRRRGSKKIREERSWVNLCDVTTAVSEVDADYYKSISRDPSRIHLFANAIDVPSYVETTQSLDVANPCILLAGSFGPNSAMNQAAEWILDYVLPIVHQTDPNVHFYIAGRNSEVEFGSRSSDRVTTTGKLESMLPLLNSVDISIVPLMFESGTRFKILEAGACRVPIVSTTLGAEGLPVLHQKHLLIADTAKDFASSILRILNDAELRESIVNNCFALVQSEFSVESLEAQAISITDFLFHD